MPDYKSISFKKGELIVKEGDSPDCAYIIKSGSVEIFTKRKDGVEVVIRRLNAGDLFGEMAMIDALPRSASVRATDHVSLMIIDNETFDKKQEALDVFTRKLIHSFIARLREQTETIANLSNPSALAKAAKKGQIDLSTGKHTGILVKEDYREKIDFGAINVLIGDSNAQARQGIKGGLHMQGFREIEDISSPTLLRNRIKEGMLDLIVLDNNLGTSHIADIIKSIRQGQTNVSPFCVIFAIIDQPEPQTLERLSNAGLDDVLVKPMTLNNLLDRVERRIKHRKPFVVTMDYVGPDRRSNLRASGEVIPLVHIPNPLAYKALSYIDDKQFAREHHEASQKIFELKIERHAVQMGWLTNKINLWREKKQDPRYFMERLGTVTQDMRDMLLSADKDKTVEICDSFLLRLSDFEKGILDFQGDDWIGFSEELKVFVKRMGPK